jgi:hypothetical protein
MRSSEHSCPVRPCAALRSAFAALVATGMMSAQSDVVATVDAAGDLWLLADDQDTGIRVQTGIPHSDDRDTFRISGIDAATTINGQASVLLFAPGTRMVLALGEGNNRAWMGTDYGADPSCCSRSLIVTAGTGDDELRMLGPFGWTTVDLGPGNDTLTVTEDAIGIVGSLRMGDGDDVITTAIWSDIGPHVDMGNGDDLLQVGWYSWIDGTFDMGPGNDHVRIERDSSGRMELRGGHGNDVFDLDQYHGGWLTLDAGWGDDEVFLVGYRDEPFIEPIDPATVFLGPGNDRLTVSDALFGHALFDGGDGIDALRSFGRSLYAFGPPDVRAFEAPKSAKDAAVGAPTTIAGRLVDEAGAAVPNASVLLPELGRLALTGPDGEFTFGGVLDARSALEVVAGARWRGRARTAAARVELVPYRTSDAGTLVLGSRSRNTLVIGAADYRIRALEGNLVSLGYRPEEITRLSGLPPSLEPYRVVWHAGGEVAPADVQRLAAFVRDGGGLHLSGSPTAAVNASLQPLVDALVRGGGITVGGAGTYAPPSEFNADAVGGIGLVPNVLTAFYRFQYARYVVGAAPRNVLASFPASGSVSAAAWEPFDLHGGRGRLTLVMSDGWIQPGESLDVVENLQRFLSRERQTASR